MDARSNLLSRGPIRRAKGKRAWHGRALIADLLARAKERGWSRLYWHTRKGNAPARHLYDEFAVADDFVRYRLNLT
jgi:ribosomal protein S18 acetylase RimI-like enzyme